MKPSDAEISPQALLISGLFSMVKYHFLIKFVTSSSDARSLIKKTTVETLSYKTHNWLGLNFV